MNTKIAALARTPRSIVNAENVPLEQIPELADLFDSSVSLENAPAYENEPTTAGEVGTRIEEGRRNNTLTSMAGSMRRRGMSEEAIFAALKVENKDKCDPPLPEAEVRVIARSIGRYEAKEPFYESSDPIAFPVQVLPRTLRRFVEEAAASIGCPPDFIGVPLIATLSAAIGNSRVLEVKSDYTESATLYTAIIGDPGSSKTPALNVATAPAARKQEELGREYQEAVAEYEREERQWEHERGDDFVTYPPQEPVFRRTVVQDTTVEALIERLTENPRGLLSNNDELSGWVRQMDQYKAGNKGSDRQFWLSSWSNRSVSVDRKGRRDPLMVSRSFVSIAGGIQPGILPELKNNREDGLLDRFLFAFPDPMPTRWSDSEISEEIMAAYEDIYEELYGLRMDTDENGIPDPRHATFTTAAKRVFVDAYNSLCEEMEHSDFPDYLKGPWSKMRAYLARLSLIIGMAKIAEFTSRRQGLFSDFMKTDSMIGERDVEAAVALIAYFKAHTRRVYAKLHNHQKSINNKKSTSNAEGGTDLAHYLVRFLKDRSGYWEGMTSQLYEICKAASVSGLPGGEGPFGKQIREIANDPDNDLTLDGGWRGKDPIIKLSLSTLGTVGSVEDNRTETTEGTESRNEDEKPTADHPDPGVHEGDPLTEIKDAMERLFMDCPDHLEDPDPVLIAMDLSFSNYLDFVPDEDQIEEVLKMS